MPLLNFTKKNKLKKSLVVDLKQACEILSHYSGGYSVEFLDAKEFYQALEIAISKFEKGDNDQVKNLRNWFAPTTEWDDFIGMEGIDLGNSIFIQLQAYINENGIKI